MLPLAGPHPLTQTGTVVASSARSPITYWQVGQELEGILHFKEEINLLRLIFTWLHC